MSFNLRIQSFDLGYFVTLTIIESQFNFSHARQKTCLKTTGISHKIQRKQSYEETKYK